MIIKRILLISSALCIGLFGAVLYLERDTQIHAVVSRGIAQGLGIVGDCSAQCALSRISLLEGVVEFYELSARSKVPGEFEWKLSNGAVSFSWRSLITRWSLAFEIQAERCTAASNVHDTNVPLVDHFKRFFETPPIPPFIVERLVLPQAELILTHPERNARITVAVGLECAIAPLLRGSCVIHNSTVTYGTYELISRMHTHVRFGKEGSEFTWSITGSCMGLLTGNVDARIVGEGARAGTLQIGDDTTPVRYEFIVHEDGTIKGTAQRGIASVEYAYSPIHGQTLSASVWGWALTLWSACRDVGTVSCANGQRRAEAQWNLRDNTAKISGTYEDGREKHTLDASVDLVDRIMRAAIDGARYVVEAKQSSDTSWSIQAQHNGITLISCTAHTDGRIEGVIDYTCITLAAPTIPLRGEGQIRFAGTSVGDEIIGTLTFDNGKIVIPKTALVIDHAVIPWVYNRTSRMMTSSDAMVRIARGSLAIHRAVVRHDEQGIVSAQASCAITHGLFAPIPSAIIVVSGNGTVSWHRGIGGKIAGELLIDRGVYDGGLSPSLMGGGGHELPNNAEPWELMIHCATRAPVEFKTPLCTLQGHSNATITGTLTKPEIRGLLYDLQGVIHFPYKPLYLSAGKITVSGGYPPAPELAITAHGVVRQYDITIHVEGPASEPHLRFESSPSLRDEQIMSLLLSGSEDGIVSVNLSHDSFSMIQSLLTAAHAPDPEPSWWTSLLAPLRRVRLIPKLNDQSGRGGVRGAVEIEVDDRLRATIQHNFSLSEDIKISVDYAISDDMHVRALRDERGDYAAELEMRWKL